MEKHCKCAENKVANLVSQPLVLDIEKATKLNTSYRTILWTGAKIQVTLMSVPVSSDIELEIHDDIDQFLRIEQGIGLVKMGKCKDNLDYQTECCKNSAVFIPMNTWHVIMNIGKEPLKLYSIYAPPQHVHGTIHESEENSKI